MCADNKKHFIQTEKEDLVQDFDAVSLYPSAMMRLYCVEGVPILMPDGMSYEELRTKTAFIVEIEITKIKKHYQFPLIAAYSTGAENQKVLNWADGSDVIGKRIVVNDIALEDLIKFQGIEFNIIRGYYWTGNKDYTVQKVVSELFERRKQYKKEGNPLEQIYKLLLNNLYGKSIQKPIDFDYKFIKGEENMSKYRRKNYLKIIDYSKVSNYGYGIRQQKDIYCFKEAKSIVNYFNNVLFGSHVLAMSKRIMNEVMCLGEDIGCQMYYQDTDSFFLKQNDLNKLEKAFEEKYQRKLIGKDMGQFHSDFTSRDGRSDVVGATECLFIRKKLYCCRLLMSGGNSNISFKAKGTTHQAVEIEALRRNPTMKIEEAIFALYQAIYNGEIVDVNLCDGKTQMKIHLDFSVETLDYFNRKIKCA
jgi:hypothetical protein